MISEKNDEKLLSFSDRVKAEFEKFNCLFVDFLRYSFGRIKVISFSGINGGELLLTVNSPKY